MQLDDVRGFVFDVDGSLVHRGPDFRAEPLPGAVKVLEAIRASGRPLVLFTNGSHMGPEGFAEGLTRDGLPVSAEELLTPVCSALSYLARRHAGERVMVFGSEATRERMASAGVPLTDSDDAQVIFVAHVEQVDLDAMEAAARAVMLGARLLTANYLRGFWGVERRDLQPRRDGRRRDLQGHRRAAGGGGQAVAGRGRRGERPAGRAVREAPGGGRRHQHGHRARPPGRVAHDPGAQRDERLGGHRGVPERQRPDEIVDGVEELLPWL